MPESFEVDAARAWLASRNLNRQQLASLTGYTAQALYWLLRGETPPRKNGEKAKIDDRVWRRFKTMCAGVDAQLRDGREFNW